MRARSRLALLVGVMLGWHGAAYAIDGAQPSAGQAFVEFRARSGPDLVGHTFIVFGRLDAGGRIAQSEVAGLYTEEEKYWKGILIPLPGFVGPEADDLRTPSRVVYRRYITAEQLRRLTAKVRQFRANQRVWHFLFVNCNDFAGEIAETVGLRRPPSLVLPVSYVAMLRILNGPGPE